MPRPGGNFLDTADFYTAGASEKLLGEFVGPERERFVIATKYTSHRRKGDPNGCGNHRKSFFDALHASLKRLKTDYIDLYWLHASDDLTPVEEVMRAFDDAVRMGKIINPSSSTTALMLPGYAAYVATKGAVEQFSHVLAKELGLKNITVNVVAPGPTDTELFGQGKSEEQRQRFGQMAALGRLGQPQDIADVVALLAGKDARWITGQNIRANDGLI